MAMVCSPKMIDELNQQWEEIGNKFKEEICIIAIALMVHKVFFNIKIFNSLDIIVRKKPIFRQLLILNRFIIS